MSMKKVWYLDVDLETPIHVRDVIEQMWAERVLGNDVYVIHADIKTLNSEDDDINYAPLVSYLREHGLAEDETVLLHYAW